MRGILRRSSSGRGHGGADERTAQLLERMRRGERAAQAEFFDTYIDTVERVLFRTIGPDSELDDLIQETFIQALTSIKSFRGDETNLRAWIRAVAVRTASKRLRKRRVRKILRLQPPEEFVELPATADPAVQATLRRAYEVLETFPVEDRLAFTLRFVDGMELKEVASAVGTSLSTVKRRLQRARARFLEIAQDDPLLQNWLPQESP